MRADKTALELLPAAIGAGSGDDQAFVGSNFFRILSRLEQEGPPQAASLHRQLLSILADRHANRINSINYPDSIKALVNSEFERIEQDTATNPDECFSVNAHALRCDYRILCFGRIPAGVEHLELGGMPRSLIFRGSVRQSFSAFRCLQDLGGRRPLFNIHLRHGIKPWTFLLVYDKKAQRQLYLNIADALILNPDVKGLIATSWWYDPALEELSPHMAFLRRTMQEAGAYVFRYRQHTGHSLANSPLRQQLFAEGKYRPCSYTVVWPRSCLLTWAEQAIRL